MSQGNVNVSVHIENTPDAVLEYIADVRNRPLFIGPLKAVSDILGDPAGAGTKWNWIWAALGMEFQGTAESLQYDPGKVYSFKTEGAITSTWTYNAEPDGDGTKLKINVDFDVPASVIPRLPVESVAERMKQAEAERVAENLQLILSNA